MPSKPKPFQRPGVSLLRHGKAWQDVSPRDLSVGDNVMNHGIIKEIKIGVHGLEFVFPGLPLPVHFDDSFPVHAFTQGK